MDNIDNKAWQKSHPLIIPLIMALVWSVTIFLIQQPWSAAETVTALLLISGLLIAIAYLIHDWLATIFVRVVPVEPERAELVVQRALSRLGVPFEKEVAHNVVDFALHNGHLHLLIEAFTPRRSGTPPQPASRLTLRLVTPFNATFAREIRHEIDKAFVARGFVPAG